MGKISYNIGVNLQKVRIARGYTLDYVCSKMDCLDCHMTPSMLSKIENGNQRIYADQMICLCQVYDCSIADVSHEYDSLDEVIFAYIKSEPMEIKKIVFWCLSEWQGNTTALWKFLGLYVSMPPRIRQMISGMGISTYNYAKQTNQINKAAPPVDIVYLTKEYRRLLDE